MQLRSFKSKSDEVLQWRRLTISRWETAVAHITHNTSKKQCRQKLDYDLLENKDWVLFPLCSQHSDSQQTLSKWTHVACGCLNRYMSMGWSSDIGSHTRGGVWGWTLLDEKDLDVEKQGHLAKRSGASQSCHDREYAPTRFPLPGREEKQQQ